MSVPAERRSPAEAVAGFMAAAALFAGLVAIVYRPARVAPAAVIVALVAVGIGGRHSRLAAWAVVAGAVGWFVGMTVAIATGHPLY